MARQGLTQARVADAAVAIADRDGLDAVTLAAVAVRLDVRPPSLYNHVSGLDGLRRLIALRGLREITEATREAALGRAGADALVPVAHAYRAYAHAHPGCYTATQYPPAAGDEEQRIASTAAVDVIVAVLRGWSLEGDDALHAVRGIRSALHGFVALEAAGGFGLKLDLDESFDRLVTALADGLGRPSDRRRPGGPGSDAGGGT